MKPLAPSPSYAAALASRAASTAALVGALNLPEPVRRRLAGPPVEIDGQRLASDTQLMLRLSRLSGPAIEAVPVARGRRVLAHQTRVAGGRQPIGSVRDLTLAGHRARLYTPSAAVAGPLLVFWHGGGFVYGDLGSHDATARFLAERSGVPVLSAEYRLAPEHPFPAAYDDALAVFDAVRGTARDLGADPDRIGVGGDSAGGNLAAGVALARPGACAFQLLLYPVTQMGGGTRSRALFGDGLYLTTGFIELASRSYVPTGVDPRDPRLSPLHAEVAPGVAPAFVATAGFDPLRDEGEAYAARLAEAGVAVGTRRYEDQIHGFVNVLVAPSSRRATADIAAALRRGLAG